MTPAERRAERTVARQRQATKQATREAQRRFGRVVCRTALAREAQRLGPRVTCDYESQGEAMSEEHEPLPRIRVGSADEARMEIGRARAVLADMRATLFGCDWCCGGGSSAAAAWSSRMEQAQAWLVSHGHEPVSVVPACGVCGYEDALPGGAECGKCNHYPW